MRIMKILFQYILILNHVWWPLQFDKSESTEANLIRRVADLFIKPYIDEDRRRED